MNFKEVYFNLWSNAWQFHKEYANVNGTDEFWKQVDDKSNELLKEYENTLQYEFMKSLLLAVVDELKRVDKEKQRQGNRE